MMIEIRWSKIIQHKQKILRLPVLPAENKAICPMFWLYHMVNRIPAAPQDPVLALRVAGQIVSLSSNQFIYRIRKRLLLIGEDARIYSLHLLRQGREMFAYEADMEGEMIKLLGDWTSDTYKRYVDISIDKRFESMKAFVEALNKICC